MIKVMERAGLDASVAVKELEKTRLHIGHILVIVTR